MAIVQPFQYITEDTTSPLLQGAQLGAAMAQSRAAQQQAAAKVAELRDRQEKELAFRNEQSRFMALPKPTTTDILRLATLMPENVQKNIGGLLSEIPKEQRNAYMRSMSEVVSAIEADRVPVALDILRKRGEANPDEAESVNRLAAMIQNDPTNAMKIVAPVIAADESGRAMLKSVADAAEARRTAADFPRLMAQRAAELAKAGSDAEKAAIDAKYAERLAQANIKKLEAEGTPTNFSVLTPADMKSRFGIDVPANTVFKRNDKTGEISAIGGAGVTVKMPPNIGNIPPDYRMIYDDAGNPNRLEVIPGSKTARELEKEARVATTRETQAGLSGMIIVDELTRLERLVKNESVFNPVTGISGRAAEKVLGSARTAAQGNLDTIKANIGFDRLAQMRAESPTGGALGNITERELAFLQSVLGSISLDQDNKVLLENIGRIKKIYEKAAAYPNAEKFGFARISQPEQEAPTPAPTAGVSPTTQPPTTPPPGAVVPVVPVTPVVPAGGIPPMPAGAVRRIQ